MIWTARLQTPYQHHHKESLKSHQLSHKHVNMSSATMSSNNKTTAGPCARLVHTLGPAIQGDLVTSLDPPPLDGNSWVEWQATPGSEVPRPTIGAPSRGFTVQAYFPAHTVRKPPSTAVYSLDISQVPSGSAAPPRSAPGSRAPCTGLVFQHDLDFWKASQISIYDSVHGTRRGLSYGIDQRMTAHAIIANDKTAMMVNLTRGGDEFHLTINDDKTGKESMTGVMKSRDGKSEWAQEGKSHCYYSIKGDTLIPL